MIIEDDAGQCHGYSVWYEPAFGSAAVTIPCDGLRWSVGLWLALAACIRPIGAAPSKAPEWTFWSVTEKQPFEDKRAVEVHCGRSTGHGHAVSIHRKVLLGAPLRPVRRVGVGEVAAALGADGATIEAPAANDPSRPFRSRSDTVS